MKNSKSYEEKKAFFDSLITVYGRNVVLETLQEESVQIHKLHLADSNKNDGVMSKILALAKQKDIEIAYHDKRALSRISKNAKQDQGVAADIIAPLYAKASKIDEKLPEGYRLIALDGIHNPQNLGMIIRSCTAGNIDGIILPTKNSAKISPLVIKASAGTLFKIPIFYCDTLDKDLPKLKEMGANIYALSSHATTSLKDLVDEKRMVFVLGNESEGVSESITALCNKSVVIPMNRGVESLNVAVTASLIAFS